MQDKILIVFHLSFILLLNSASSQITVLQTIFEGTQDLLVILKELLEVKTEKNTTL
jgi:hypothetical protein